MDSKQFYGVHTALVTPFSDGKVNYAVLERLVSRQIEEGVDGLVSVGTTGESPTLDFEEHIEEFMKEHFGQYEVDLENYEVR